MIPRFVPRTHFAALIFIWAGVVNWRGSAPGAPTAFSPPSQPFWGRITEQTNGTGLIHLDVRAWPADGKLALPTPFPNITAAHLIDGRQRIPLKWVVNADA